MVSLEPIYSYLEKLGLPFRRRRRRCSDRRLASTIYSGCGVGAGRSCSERTASHFRRQSNARFTAEHLAAELLRSGRLKDLVRVIDLMQSDQFDAALFQD